MSSARPQQRGEAPALVRADGGPGDLAPEAEVGLEVERASATPLTAPEPEASVCTHAIAAAPVGGPLAQLEAWFSAVITHPESVSAGVAAAAPLAAALGATSLEALVTGSPRQSALARLGIYHHAYHARLVSCLADDFPVVKHALGAETFTRLARRYVEVHPSRGPNLVTFGRAFPGFCRTQADVLERPDLAADLAELEWAIVEVIHAAPCPPIAPAVLEAVPPEAWPEVTFTPSPSLRLLEHGHPVNGYLGAVKRGESPELPGPAPAFTAVHRKDWAVWRMSHTPLMAQVLRSLLAGAPLGEALACLEAGGAEPRAEDVTVWFREWIAGGFFASLERP